MRSRPLEKAQQNAQQQMQQQQPAAKKQDAQINVKPKFTVLPGSGSRMLLGQNTTETKFKMDMEMQARNNGPTPSQAPAESSTQADGPNSVTFTMTMDMFVAPSVAGYQEVSEFYKRMAKEVNWVPPASIHVDPRMTQGMAEMQKNSAALKGLPMLSYISMGMPAPPNGAADSTQNSSGTTLRSNSSSSTSSDTMPTNSSDAVVKGLGSLFGKKKQQDNSSSQASSPAPPPNPNSDPNALMEMTMQVTSFSDSSLDAGLSKFPPATRAFSRIPIRSSATLRRGSTRRLCPHRRSLLQHSLGQMQEALSSRLNPPAWPRLQTPMQKHVQLGIARLG
jgi:hypothetical protein